MVKLNVPYGFLGLSSDCCLEYYTISQADEFTQQKAGAQWSARLGQGQKANTPLSVISTLSGPDRSQSNDYHPETQIEESFEFPISGLPSLFVKYLFLYRLSFYLFI